MISVTSGMFPATIPPITNITPFTYRDGMTYLELLYAIRDYVTETIVPGFDTEMSRIIADFNAGIANAETVITDRTADWETRFAAFIANFTNEVQTLNDAAVAGMVTDPAGAARAALLELINTEIAAAFNDPAVAAFITDETSDTRAEIDALIAAGTAGKVDKGAVLINVRDYGAKGDWDPYTLTGTDDTAAIKAAIAAAPMASTVYFPGTGPNKKYLISEEIVIATPNLRILGAPRDTYATSIRMNVTGGAVKSMFVVKTTGVVFESIGIEGGGGAITGIENWGDVDGNGDARYSNVTFMRLLVGLRTRSRNNTVANECLFSISTEGWVVDGPHPVYHTGVGAQNNMRGNKCLNARFHGNGSNSAHGSIHILPAARVISMQIADNEFDGGAGSYIIAEGEAAYPAQHLTMHNNAMNQLGLAYGYIMTHVQNSTIDGADILGDTATVTADAISLTNCKWFTIANSYAHNIGRSGIKIANSSYLWIRDTTMNVVGRDTAGVYDGITIDAISGVIEMDNITVVTAPGYGINGSPINASSLASSHFFSCTLGSLNSTTLHNPAALGRNVYTEGSGGRKTDIASKSFDLVAAAPAVNVAIVTGATNYTSFEVEVTVIGRNTAGAIFYKGTRYVRPENGNPQYLTVGADTTTTALTIAFTTSGTSGVNVTAAVTGSDAFVTVHVAAKAGGGVSSAASRGVNVNLP